MKKSLKFSALFLLILVLASCEDVVQVKLDEGSKLYVIDAFINDKAEIQTVAIHESDNYFSNREAPPVSTASVVLKDLTANTQFNFAYTSQGKYTYDASTLTPVSGLDHLYELNVTIGGVTYTSQCTQKRTAKIDSISVFYVDDSGGFGPSEPFYTCFLWARDRVDQNADYYWIKTYRNDTLFGLPSDLNLAIDGTGGAVYDPNVDTLNFTPPSIYLGFSTYKKGDVCKVEIHSITREAFNFLNQAVIQIQNGGLFATTPENVKTNIVTPSGAGTKAIGWFSMSKVNSKSRLVQ
ncbi:MAG TPA: DUF4249 family protein [Bacteroidia bacterium]|nr:DUF4249 family protein [Bacteroidia bacterium]